MVAVRGACGVMGWKEKSKYTLWAMGVSCSIVAEAEAAKSLFENRKTPFEWLDLTKNLNKTHLQVFRFGRLYFGRRC